MNRISRFVPLFLLFSSFAFGQEKVDRAEPNDAAPLGKSLEWTSTQGRPYWYRLPKKIDPKSPPNLIVMLHGTGMDHRWSFWNYGVAQGEFRKNDIVLSPDGLTAQQGGKTFNFVQGKEDGEQVAGLIQLFRKRFPVANVYLYGHSQGAFFVYWFAGEHPDLVNGFVAHAGNVLADVKFPKLAKDSMAIGILHGKEDAVVPVDCAYSSEEAYKKEGFKKIKLRVVEGLTKESGHWPLPKEVAEMLDWCDSVCSASAESAIAAALTEIAKKDPDLPALAATLDRAAQLMKREKTADDSETRKRYQALTAFVQSCGSASATELQKEIPKSSAKPAYGAWAAQFRLGARAFPELDAWKSPFKAFFELGKNQEKAVVAAIASLSSGKKTAVRDAIQAAESGFLAPSYDSLLDQLKMLADRPGDSVPQADRDKIKTFHSSRNEFEWSGKRSFQKTVSELAAKFKEEHKDWF